MADYGASVGAAVVGKCTEILVDPFLRLIWKQITRVFKWESNVKNLKKKAEKLVAEKQRVLQFTEAADRRGEEVALNFMNWLTSAEKYIGKIEKLGDDEDKAKKKCLAGLCPNPKARYQISKKVEEYLEAVDPLLEEATGFKFSDSYRPPPKEIYTAPVKGFEDFDSRKSALNGIMEALRSAGVVKIGLHGMAGVGKTMLAKEVARQAEEAQLFDTIVMADVKRNPDLKSIQGDIAEKLGVQLHGETEFGRAYQLKAYLKKMKRILVILDDIWTSLDLDELGIPLEDKREASSIGETQDKDKKEACSIGEKQDEDKKEACSIGEKQDEDKMEACSIGEEQVEDKKEACSIGEKQDEDKKEEQVQCKILFASRFLNVLRDMHTQRDFEVGQLHEEEAWELFKNLVGSAIEKSVLKPTAMEIAKECAGLPLAVKVVAIALKNKSPQVWSDALRELQRPSPENFTGIPAKVYSAIELSYNHLERNELQQSFLLCGLLALTHDASIEDLLKYGIGLNLFHNVKTIGEGRDRVLRLVSDLKSCSLLLDGASNMHFNMHDMVCDVAISIASRDNVFSLIDGDLQKRWSDREALEGFNWIRLQSGSVSELPDELECPQLTLFSMCSKDPFMKIPENFFRGTLKLRVLNFSKLHFSSLPSSICLLENLQTLHVNESVLEDSAIIGKLMSLEVLSLSGCDIEELPGEIAQLTQLKLLDLSNCTKLKLIRPHMLSSLSKLEELYLGNSFDRWDFVKEDANQKMLALLS